MIAVARTASRGVRVDRRAISALRKGSRKFWCQNRNSNEFSRGDVPLIVLNSSFSQMRFCSNSDPKNSKKPAKGFEKFFREHDSRKADKKTEKKGPSEDTASKKDSNESKESKSKGGGSGNGGNDMLPPNAGLAIGVLALLLMMGSNGETPGSEITVQELIREYLIKGYVSKIQILNRSFARITIRGDAPGTAAGKVFVVQLSTPEAFEAKLEQVQMELGLPPLEHVPIQYVNEADYMSEFLPHLPSLIFLGIMLGVASRMSSSGMGGGAGGGGGGRNPFNIGKAMPAGKKDLKSTTKFTDVAGMEQAKREVVEFVDFLKDPAKFEKLGARVPKGGLLVGPPGTGKTLLAKAVAGEADCPFYSMSGSDFIEMYVGVGPSRVRDLFGQARKSAPSIIFIDEIDAVGRKRGGGGFSGGGNDERENTLNQMLVEMDGFSSGTGVVVLAGTNRADILDPALKRPGRFDRQIAIDKPDLTERQEIFKVHLKPIAIGEELSMDSVAKRMAALTPGFAGADIANICNEAAIHAARREAPSVDMQDFERATERVMAGLPKNNSLMSAAEKRTVALHEAGHAIVGWFLENADPLLKVSIVPRSSGALGFAQYLPEEMALYSKEAMLDKIAVSLGGRAAEELFVGRISTGASDDLNKVTNMAYSMVSVYGMNSKIGLLSYSENNPSQRAYKPYSEETGQLIDREARSIVDEQYERVKQLLTEKKELMTAMADALAEKETLVFTDLREILGDRPFAVKEQYERFVSASGQNPFSQEAAVADSKIKQEGTPDDK